MDKKTIIKLKDMQIAELEEEIKRLNRILNIEIKKSNKMKSYLERIVTISGKDISIVKKVKNIEELASYIKEESF